MATRAHRIIGGAAVLVAALGAVVVVADDGASACDVLRDRIEELVPSSATAAQRWEDLLLLSERADEGLRLMGEYRQLGCRPTLPGSSPSTVPPPGDARLPAAADLGPTFADRPSRGAIEGPGRTAYCDVEVPDEPEPGARAVAWYTSQAALQEVAVEVVDYADAAEAGAAFATMARHSHCRYEGNLEEGIPVERTIDGAERAMTIGFTNDNGAHGLAVALVGPSVVVVWVDVHFGAATTDLVPSRDLLALVVARVRAELGGSHRRRARRPVAPSARPSRGRVGWAPRRVRHPPTAATRRGATVPIAPSW